MTPHEIRRALVEVLGEVAPDADPSTVRDDEDLVEALDLDSMDHLNLVTGIGERLGVEVPERDYPRLRTIADAVDYLAAARA